MELRYTVYPQMTLQASIQYTLMTPAWFQTQGLYYALWEKFLEEKNSSQASLFSADDNSSEGISIPKLANINEWSPEECLSREKELIGFYLSGDPLEDLYEEIKEFSNINLIELPKKLPEKIKIGGIITGVNQRFDKKNRPWAIVSVDGMQGSAEVFVFNESYEKHKEQLKIDNKVFIVGSPSNRSDDSDILKFIGNQFMPLEEARKKMSRAVNVKLTYSDSDELLIDQLIQFAQSYKGRSYLIIHLQTSKGNVQRIRAKHIRVNPTKDFILKLRQTFGDSNIWIAS